MAKATIESALTSPSVVAAEKPPEGVKLVTILYSRSRDLYRVLAMERPCWLSVSVYELPAPELPADGIYLGAAKTADGLGWRKAYARTWQAIIAGEQATVPADDRIVSDYKAFGAEEAKTRDSSRGSHARE
jgi:hypothetical protein